MYTYELRANVRKNRCILSKHPQWSPRPSRCTRISFPMFQSHCLFQCFDCHLETELGRTRTSQHEDCFTLISVVFAIFGLISGRLVHTNDSISDTYHRIPPKTLLTEKAMVNVGQTQTRASVQETQVLFWIVFGLFHPGSVLLYPQVCGSQQENAWTRIWRKSLKMSQVSQVIMHDTAEDWYWTYWTYWTLVVF